MKYLSVILSGLLLGGICQGADFPDPSLTPYGAEKMGNAGGTIPEWQGGLSLEAAPSSNSVLTDPFHHDARLYSIDAGNAGSYRDLLNPGQHALLQRYPSYRIDVYPSRRSAAAPSWVYDNIARNHLTAKLSNGGNGIENAFGGIPFPVPTDEDGTINPHKVLWNHLTRWRGVYLSLLNSEAPVHENGSYSLVTNRQEVSFLMYHPDKRFEDIDNKLAYLIAAVQSPARLAGTAALVHETLDRVKEERAAWIYDSGSRRVRKAPTLAYDTPIQATDSLLTADMVDMFNGAPDRYHWRFVGKREMLIPYNSYRLSLATDRPDEMIRPGHINPEFTRHEVHRVWVVEGQLKEGVRSIYGKRTFYIDEDTWFIVQSDLYDSRQELWRVHLAHPVNYYQVPVVWPAATVMHDLRTGRYHLSYLENSNGQAVRFDQTPPRDSYFTQQSLRRMGR
jgi:hypothetical protein